MIVVILLKALLEVLKALLQKVLKSLTRGTGLIAIASQVQILLSHLKLKPHNLPFKIKQN